MQEPTLREALAVVAKHYRAYHERKILRNTAHNAECISISMELFTGGAELDEKGEVRFTQNDLSGRILLEGRRNDLPKTPQHNLFATLFTEETTNEVPFDNIEELAQLLES